MTSQATYTIRPLLPSWPCWSVGLPSHVSVALEAVSPLLPATPSPVAILLVPRSQTTAHPFFVVHPRFLCLLEAFPVAVVLLEWRACLPYGFPVAIAVVSTTRSLLIVWPSDYFPHASPWPILLLTP